MTDIVFYSILRKAVFKPKCDKKIRNKLIKHCNASIVVQFFVILWLKQHNLGKYWVICFVFSFLKQFLKYRFLFFHLCLKSKALQLVFWFCCRNKIKKKNQILAAAILKVFFINFIKLLFFIIAAQFLQNANNPNQMCFESKPPHWQQVFSVMKFLQPLVDCSVKKKQITMSSTLRF